MSFKIKDSFQIGTNTVFNSSGLLQNSAITASLTFSNNTAGGVSAGAIIVSAGGMSIFGAIYAGSLQNTPIGTVTRAQALFTSLDANSTVTLNPASANVTISPSGNGTVTISPSGTGALIVNPATLSSIDNTTIGLTTPVAGKFTTLQLTSTVTLSPANASVTISPTGTGGVTIAPTGSGGLTINPTTVGTLDNTAIGNTTRGSGKFTTLDANNTVTLNPANTSVTLAPSGTGTVVINPNTVSTMDNVAIGNTVRSSGKFTTLDTNSTVTLNPANFNVTISPSGTGTVTIAPVSTVAITPTGVLTINPTAASTINNCSIGATTRSTGAFTTLTANGATTLTSGTASSSSITGALVVTGGVGISGDLNIGGALVSTSIQNTPIGSTTRSSGAFTTLDANAAVGLSPANANVTISPTGTGTVSISPASTVNISPTGILTISPVAASAINNCSIGASTRSTGAFTTLTTNGATTFTSGTSSTTSSTGAVVITGGIGVGENANIGGNLIVTGNLTVNGTTATINSTTQIIEDPIISLGGGLNGAAPVADDGKDRGVGYQYYTTVAKTGFFGYDRSTGYFTFVPDATISSEVVSGAFGDFQATNFRGALIGNADTTTKLATARSITASGDASWTVSFDGTGNVTAALTLATVNANTTGPYNSFTVNGKGLVTSASAIAYLTAETDTLQSVTTRGNTTTTNIQLNNASLALAPVATAKIWLHSIAVTVNVNTLSTIDSWLTSTYRSAQYVIQITQGTKYQQSTFIVLHDNTLAYVTEFAVVESNGGSPIPCAYSASISAGTLTVSATITDAATTSASLLIQQTLFSV
jgi:hypothetical protein